MADSGASQSTDEQEDSSTAKSVGRPKSSFVWRFFQYDATSNKTTCKSTNCNFEQPGTKTSNLRVHLSRRHQESFTELQKEEKAAADAKSAAPASSRKSTASKKSASKWKDADERQVGATEALAAAIACTSTAVNFVEHTFFELFCERLNVDYAVPGRTKVTSSIDDLFSLMKEKVLLILLTAGLLTICTDVWSKKGLSESFLGVTAHFLNAKWEHCVVTLAVCSFPHPHTAERVRALVLKILEEWNIDLNRVFLVVTDNGSNMVAAFKEARENMYFSEEMHAVEAAVTELNEKDTSQICERSFCEEETAEQAAPEMFFPSTVDETLDSISNLVAEEVANFDTLEFLHDNAFTNMLRLPCFNHLLQLVVRQFDTVADHRKLVKKSKAIVTKFNKSGKATSLLIQHCGKKLIADVETRWNSTYAMIARLCELRADVGTVCAELKWNCLIVSDWEQLKALKMFLEPFDVHTTLTSGQKYTTTDLYIPVLSELDGHLRKCLPKNLLATTANVVLGALDSRFVRFIDPSQANHNAFYVAACLFHPFLRHLLTPEQSNSAAKYIRALYVKHYTDDDSSSQQPESEESASPKRFRWSHNEEKLARIRTQIKASQDRSTIESELQEYRASKFHGYTENSDAVTFWRSKDGVKFPKLSKVAHAFLGAVAASVSAEQVFSISGMKSDGRRNRLSGYRLEAETLLHKNLQYYKEFV